MRLSRHSDLLVQWEGKIKKKVRKANPGGLTLAEGETFLEKWLRSHLSYGLQLLPQEGCDGRREKGWKERAI